MDNKLNELSKPVAWTWHAYGLQHATTEEDERDELIADGVENSPLYSQEYVSALLAELEAKDKRIAELEAKLATPVRLPDIRQSSSGDRYQWSDGAHNYRLD
ncbi:hypothetical protein GST35_25715, partial [Serratia marcescens]|nr:hypothetical protein [Serratia marcescens]